jgi:hypothetical protein
MSKRVNTSHVFLNGVDITRDVYSVELSDRPGDLLTAKVELYVQSVGTVLNEETGRVEVTYKLGSVEEDDRCPGCGEPASKGPHGPDQGYGGCV